MSAPGEAPVWDWLIVGSGFGGSVSALRLAEKGYRVAVLEAGRRWQPEDFPRSNWRIQDYLWAPRIGLRGIQRINLLDDVMILSGAGVGGGSLVYANTLLVPPDEVLESEAFAPLGNRAGLEPHYHTAKRMLGVARSPVDGPVEAWTRELAASFGRADTFHHADVGIFFGEPNKRVPDPYFDGEGPERVGCNFCAACMTGCRVGAKNTLDRNYLWLAEQRGVEILAERQVTRIRPCSEGGARWEIETERSTALLRRQPQRLRARNVIVAAGVLGTLRLLLEGRRQGDLPHLSSQLGTLVRTNSEAIVAVTGGPDTDVSHGIAITSGFYPDPHTHIEPVRYTEGADAMSLLSTLLTDGGGGIPRWLRWIGGAIRHPIRFFRATNPFGWARRTVILLVMQTLDSHLTVGLRRRLLWPWSRRLSSRGSSEGGVPSYIPVANEAARRLAERMHGTPQSALNEVLLDIPTTAHILGGCGIGNSPENSVLAPNHEVWGHPGLFVIDGSAVPGNLGVNPSLTITAMAERAMAGIPTAANAAGDTGAHAT